ncbi:MAG: lamin tail domain-containing protein [Sedimentisphaerales bacterium]|nr:lamin tail domain-containing protein [Sedimentisphaerales bacterium]
MYLAGAVNVSAQTPSNNQSAQIILNEIMYYPYSHATGAEEMGTEYIELFNRGSVSINLAGWRLADGVDFIFPDVMIGSGEYLVIAADVNAFTMKYPGVFNVVGGWNGRLSNSGEVINLVDNSGETIDSVGYCDQGDWGARELGPRDYGHCGWLWISGHDGGGKSLELINPALPNEYGQNWTASDINEGTPGMINSVLDNDIAPLILDAIHFPIIPDSSDAVTITAHIVDELLTDINVILHYRVDNSVYRGEDIYPLYESKFYREVTMFDDGGHNDGGAGDGVYGAVIPAQQDGEIVEFFIEAIDAGENRRTWPAPSFIDGSPEQVTNALYQVDDSFNADSAWVAGSQPVYYLIMTEMSKGRLLDIGDREGGEYNSDAQVDATFVSVDGIDIKVRHNLGVRNRGHGSRDDPPNNYRLNFPHDRPWKGVSAINLNTKYTYFQLAGNALFRMSGLPQPDVTAVQVRINGENLSVPGLEMYGSYAHVEVVDSDFFDNHFQGNSAGNVYKCIRDLGPADLRYRGPDPDSYRNSYFKRTNTAEDNWSDLLDLCYVMSDTTGDDIYVEEVKRVVNVDQWLRFFAINALLDNSETSISNGYGDDYYLYRGSEDRRFVLIQHDLDTIFGRNGSTTSSIFRAVGLPTISRFLTHPEFLPRYYFHLKDLIETTFSAERLGPFLDNLLGDFVLPEIIEQMKDFVAERNQYVLSVIPSELTIGSDLFKLEKYYRSTLDTFTLYGTADPVETRSVLVNGKPANWMPVEGMWDFGGYGGIAETLVSARSIWKYLDDGSDQGMVGDGSNWFAHPDFNDLDWNEGPAELGYGDASQGRAEGTVVNSGPDGNTFITTYFRHSFNISNVSQYSEMYLRLLRDDGAIVYLNGAEIIRSNMPGGLVDYLTLAGTGVSDSDESTFSEFSLDADLLNEGTNVLAVEIHQSAPTSADISFDLELVGIVPSYGAGTLRPGINRIFVETFDGPGGTGKKLESNYIDIWYDDGDIAEISGILESDTTLDAASGPWLVKHDLTVPAGITLVIEPGTTVFFEDGTSLIINGRLTSQGTKYERIRLTRHPYSSSVWDGIDFNSAEDNCISYLDMEYSSNDSESVSLNNSKIMIDNLTWTETNRTIIRINDSSVIVRNSIFPDTTVQTISGHGELLSDPYLVFENNIFGVCSGDKQDVVDISTNSSYSMPQFINNIFLGGGDDGLDLDGTSAYIEGNVFTNFHRNFSPEEGESYAITTGYDGVQSSNHVIVRNQFINCDNAVLVKDRSWIRFENNTVAGCTGSGINFDEPQENGIDPGEGGYLAGNIFWNTPRPLGYYYVEDPQWGTTDISVHYSIIPAEWHYLGIGNIEANPVFVDPSKDFHLKAGSAGIGTGPLGIDMGAYVPGGAVVAGEPDEVTYQTSATLMVGGAGITHYKYSINNPVGPWSQERPVDMPIEMTNLRNGESYVVFVIGKNAAGRWQREDEPTVSGTWTIDTSYSRLVINEVLAVNSSTFEHEGTFPDLIELYYDGPTSLDLSGMSITDNADEPTKFVFPTGTTIEPGEYLVLYADSETATSGIHLDFALRGNGESIYLYNNSGELSDSVEFGLQLPDFSIGRIGYEDEWQLTLPTFGQANIVQPVGDVRNLKINEWLANGEVLFNDDFIELFNPDFLPVNLSGLYLSDNPETQPDKYQIGALNFIAGQGFAVFGADGGDRPGHLNFRLSADVEIIGLSDGELKEIDRVIYGPQTTDISEGRMPDGTDNFEFFELPSPGVANRSDVLSGVTVTTIISEDADKYVIVPSCDIGEGWKTETDYDNSSWLFSAGVAGGIGFERSVGFEDLIALNIEEQMYLINTSCYVRIPFRVETNITEITELILKVRYDDGFIAYLNGIEIARRNFIDTPAWNSGASASHSDSEAVIFENIGVSEFINGLKPGDNILAIQGMNRSITSSDMLISTELDATIRTSGSDYPYTNVLELLHGLRITELMYHASLGSRFDYIELQNIGQTSMNLEGVYFSKGIEFTFPEMTLEAGQYVVVAADVTSFQAMYGQNINVAGEYSGNLSNNGEEIILSIPLPLEAAILRFDYDDAWYPTTDGDGDSLVIKNIFAPSAAWDNSESWQPAAPTPGRA